MTLQWISVASLIDIETALTKANEVSYFLHLSPQTLLHKCFLVSKSLPISLKIISFNAALLPALEDKLCQVILVLFTFPLHIRWPPLGLFPHYRNRRITHFKLADGRLCFMCNILHTSLLAGLLQQCVSLTVKTSACLVGYDRLDVIVSDIHGPDCCFWDNSCKQQFILCFL